MSLNTHPEYPELFRKAFGRDDTITTMYLMYAIAQFERTLISSDSRYDQYRRGQIALTPQELQGKALFEDPNKGDCFHCHVSGGLFTDFEFRNNGLVIQGGGGDDELKGDAGNDTLIGGSGNDLLAADAVHSTLQSHRKRHAGRRRRRRSTESSGGGDIIDGGSEPTISTSASGLPPRALPS